MPDDDDVSAVIEVRTYRASLGCGSRHSSCCGRRRSWLGGLEVEAMSMLDDYSAVVVEDTVDLCSRWPAEQPSSGVGA